MARVIYLSGSISGGREDVDLYCEIAEALESRGIEVVAGEVTNRSVTSVGETGTPRGIFERDMKWIEDVGSRGGVLVAEVSRPSTGVGYEIAAARYLYRVPVICLWSPAYTQRCTAMIEGDAGITLLKYDRSDRAELMERLERKIAELCE